MYLLLGKENCSRCDVVKNILTNKKIEFEYKLLESLPEQERKQYIQLARQSNRLEMPLIIKDDVICDLKEVI